MHGVRSCMYFDIFRELLGKTKAVLIQHMKIIMLLHSSIQVVNLENSLLQLPYY